MRVARHSSSRSLSSRSKLPLEIGFKMLAKANPCSGNAPKFPELKLKRLLVSALANWSSSDFGSAVIMASAFASNIRSKYRV